MNLLKNDGRSALSDWPTSSVKSERKVEVQQEPTLASITFQNYLRLYPKLAGMTGTAMIGAENCGNLFA